MSWFSTNEAFPPAVRSALLPEGTRVQEHYIIGKALRVSGTELTYQAVDARTDTPVLLHEFLPLRWCMRGEEHVWIPYNSDEESAFAAVKTACLTRMESLCPYTEEAALQPLLAVFEAFGTVWTVTAYAEETTLSEALAQQLFTPQDAIDLLAPVMDTLAGLHEIAICHGAVSSHSIVLQGEDTQLIDWFSGVSAETSASADVRAVSTLLYRMMTGEQVWNAETAAALPAGIRRALHRGMEGEDLTMEMLWKKLHADRPKKRRTRMQRKNGNAKLGKIFTPAFAVIFCILCCAVPAAILLSPLYSGRMQDTDYALSEEEIRVPELLYLSQEEAVQTAESLGLHVIIAAREDNPVVEENLIVTQKPNAGAILKAGETIQLVVSDGWSNYVPDVCNMMKEDAVEVLEGLGFVVKCEEILSIGDAPGTVISQSVKPETSMKRDSLIKLVVSLGRDDIDTSKLEEVGNYVGMDFEEAKLLLAELHLYGLQTEAVYDPIVPKGVVISQEIPEGRRVPQGTMINMVVSLGVETTRVPQVTLMNVNSAKALLDSARLKTVVIYAANTSYAADSVISQATAPGELVPVGSEIWLTVSTGNKNTVISTGGWSGNPLPTYETSETDTSDTRSDETVSTEETSVSGTTVTDPSETDMTETSEIPPQTQAPESTKPQETTEAPPVSDTQAPSETEAAPMETDPPEVPAPETQPQPEPTDSDE